MRVGILQTGHVTEPLLSAHGPYSPMFDRLLAEGDADPAGPIATETFDVTLAPPPDAATAAGFDGWMITGSKHGVYDDLPWIAPLEAFLRERVAAGAPVIGVCFGHQVLAQAMGGVVRKSARGWGVGRRRYQVAAPDAFLGALAGGALEELSLHAMHQDQVEVAPPGAQVIAGSEFCPIAALSYGDPAAPQAISIQPHPEFSAAFLGDLIAHRRGDGLPEALADAATASLGPAVDAAAMGEWFRRFLRGARARSAG